MSRAAGETAVFMFLCLAGTGIVWFLGGPPWAAAIGGWAFVAAIKA